MEIRPLQWPVHLGEALLRSLVMTAMANPMQVAGGGLAISYGLRNPSTRNWTIRMCCAYGRNTAYYIGRQFSDTALITWSETFGKEGVKRRAASRAAARAAARRTAAKSVGKKAGKRVLARSIGRRLMWRAIPLIGWGILIYDVVDYLHGDDPSFFGDIVHLLSS